MFRWTLLAAAAVMLAACEGPDPAGPAPSPPPPSVAEAVMDEQVAVTGGRLERARFAQAGEEATAEAAAPGGALLAYRYDMALELPAAVLADTQSAHARACMEAGPQRCQVIAASVNNPDSPRPSAFLSLRAAPDWLAAFRADLESEAEASGGSVISASTRVEDLTARIVDSEARLAAQTTLRDRLLSLLETRDGDLSDLLAVERQLAQVQADLDARASVLAALRQRVDTSVLDIRYQAERQIVEPDAFDPIGEALEQMGEVFARSVAAIIVFVAGVLPWLVILIPLLWLVVHTLVRAIRGRRAKAGG